MDLKRLTALAEGLREKSVKAQHGVGRNWYSIANDGSTTKVYIYDMIGEWGVTAQDFVQELRGIKTAKIDLHVNSEGGQVFDGIAIYAALKNHPAEITVRVDALAASAASFIVQAGDHRIMEPNARLMIHDAMGVCMGNAEAARDMVRLLEDTSDNIANIYAERSGRDAKEWRKAMKNETWYSAEEAVEQGLADEIAGNEAPVQPVAQKKVETPQKTTWDFDITAVVKECIS